jgi:hypothetical protein
VERRQVATALACAVIAVAATACGGGSAASDYRGKVNEVRQRYEPQFDTLTRHIQTDVTGHDQKQLGADARQGAALMKAYADEVAAIEPPSALEAQSAKLVSAYREWATALRRLATGAQTGRAATVDSALRAFNDAQHMEQVAVQAINAAG